MIDGLIVDNFAGGGGASLGLEWALGRSPDIAINHDREAIAMHKANHPATQHYCNDVWKVDPRKVCGGKPVAVAWFSPDCKHHSKAKGGKPVNKKIRDLAWVVHRWAKAVRPALIMLENVEEFRDWGPLITTEDGKKVPCPVRKGLTYKRWKKKLVDLGYLVEERERRAYKSGAPTIRKRLYVIARCDGRPIVWPEGRFEAPDRIAEMVRQGKAPALKVWRTAADCIDFSLPCPSIFERRKPLVENTMRRIARGVWRYVIHNPKPFLVPRYGERPGQAPRISDVDMPFATITPDANVGSLVQPFLAPVTHPRDQRVHAIDEPLRTVTGAHRGELAYVAASIARIGQTGGGGKYVNAADEPLSTATSKAEHLLVSAHLVGAGGPAYSGKPTPVDRPMGAQTTENHKALVATHLTKFCTGATGSGMHEPMPTVTANSYIERPGGAPPLGVVAAFLAKHYGGHETDGKTLPLPFDTVTARDHHALVAAHLLSLKGSDRRDQVIHAPAPSITAQGGHLAEVRAFLIKYYGTAQGAELVEPMHTVTVDDRFALVMVEGEPYRIVDIGMRMLTPRELFRAQGFPDSYIIAPWMEGRISKTGRPLKAGPLTGEAQVRMAGNSVCPTESCDLARANAVEVGIDLRAALQGWRAAA